MNTFDEFDEQTDFSFLSLEQSAPVAVTPKKSRSVQSNNTIIGVTLSNRGRPAYFVGSHTTETKAKISQAKKGHTVSESTKTKIANTLRGRPSKKAMSVMTPNGKFRSLTEAAEFYGTDDGFIRRALNWDIGFYYITKD